MLLNEISIKKIEQENKDGFPNTKKRQHIVNLVNARNITFVPYDQSGDLTVKSSVLSKGHTYNASIEFSNVRYHERGPVSFRGSDNEVYNIDPIRIWTNDVKLSCECLDFRFRFANLHNNNDSLLGDPPPPYMKVPGSNRPPVNPFNALGACKHLLAVSNRLYNMRVIR